MPFILEHHPRLMYCVLIFVLGVMGTGGFSFDTGIPLDTLVQTEVVVLAIIIVGSIAAVQIASSAHSTKVITVFRSSPDFWGVVLLYSTAIFFTWYTMNMSGVYGITCNILGILCFAVLIPYAYIFVTMLTPLTIYRGLAKKITAKTILDSDDPVLPLTDLVHTSIMKYDYETARNTIRVMGAAFCDVLKQNKKTLKMNNNNKYNNIKSKFEIKSKSKYKCNDSEKIISKRIYDHFLRISSIAATQKNEYLLITTMRTIDTIRDIAVKKDFKEITTATIDIINDIGKKAVTNSLEKAATEAIKSLSAFTIKLLQEEYIPEAVIVLGYINDIGTKSFKKFLKGPVHQEIFSLKDAGDIAKEKNLKFMLTVTKNYLESLQDAIKKKDAMAAQWCSAILEKLKE